MLSGMKELMDERGSGGQRERQGKERQEAGLGEAERDIQLKPINIFFTEQKEDTFWKTALIFNGIISFPICFNLRQRQLPYGPTNGYFTCHSTNYDYIS